MLDIDAIRKRFTETMELPAWGPGLQEAADLAHDTIPALCDEVERLRARLDDWESDARAVSQERCGSSDDERHCTCVPLLRRALRECQETIRKWRIVGNEDERRLRDEVERLRSALREIASPDCGRVMMSDGHYSIDGDAPHRIARRALGEQEAS